MTTTKKLTRKIEINAPVDRVFSFLTDPNHILEVMPSLTEVANIDRKADGAHSFDYVYKMAGLRLHGHSATSMVEKNKRVIVKNTGGIPSTFDYTYEAVGKGMRLTLNVDYSIPGSVLAKLAEPIVHRVNEHEAETFLQNVKTRIEMGKPGTEETHPAVH
jgi:carbon monoxide dehydrogenase subunit G